MKFVTVSVDGREKTLLDGPWISELERGLVKHEWTCGEFRCSMKRNMFLAWCGYVHLPSTHPDFGRKYGDLESEIRVHGGLTYGRGDGVFGFDCDHAMTDLSPMGETLRVQRPALFPSFVFGGGAVYWTFERVKEETERLAGQFAERG